MDNKEFAEDVEGDSKKERRKSMRKMMLLMLAGLVWGSITSLTPTTCVAAEQVKPVTLRWSQPITENSWYGEQHKWWASEFEKRTGGRFKTQIFWMQSLSKLTDGLPVIQNRIADIAFMTASYHPSNFPLFITLDTVYNSGDDYVAAMLAALDTEENEPNLRAELEKQKVVHIIPWHAGGMQIGTKKCLNSLKDLRGMTVRTVGGTRNEFIKQLGANPIFMSSMDMYEALDRGTIQASEVTVMVAVTTKLNEVARCWYMTNSGTVLPSGVFMNLDLFKSLPQEDQEMILKLRKEYAVRFGQAVMDMEAETIREWETKYGMKRKQPSPEEQKILFEAGRKANEIFIKQQESVDPAAGKVMRFYMNALKKYEAERAKKK
jgi:TRAP-type transport system periplasmic protein